MTANQQNPQHNPNEQSIFTQNSTQPASVASPDLPDQPQRPSPSENSEPSLPDTQPAETQVWREQEAPPFSVAKSQESTRSTIAWTFTLFYLTLLFLSLIGPFVINLAAPKTFADPIEASKLVTTNMASVLSGPFGFIIGFYFKENEA
jgi:hypothetical protein